MTDFWTIASTALGTGLATAAFNQGITWWREAHKDKRAARYLAIRLAVILERYALDCADRIADIQSEEAGFKLPDLAAYPDEESWKSLDPELLEQALSLRHEMVLADQYIDFSWRVEGDPTNGEQIKQCGKCGYIALDLAREMRDRYRLRPFNPLKTGWDIRKALKRKFDEVIQEANARNLN